MRRVDWLPKETFLTDRKVFRTFQIQIDPYWWGTLKRTNVDKGERVSLLEQETHWKNILYYEKYVVTVLVAPTFLNLDFSISLFSLYLSFSLSLPLSVSLSKTCSASSCPSSECFICLELGHSSLQLISNSISKNTAYSLSASTFRYLSLSLTLQNLFHKFLSQFKWLQLLWTSTLQSLSRACPTTSYPSSSCSNFCEQGLYNLSPELVPQVLIFILVAPTAWTGIFLLAMTQGRVRKIFGASAFIPSLNDQVQRTWDCVG